jgi:HAD superfamily hydrolase (TIGR01509 family)
MSPTKCCEQSRHRRTPAFCVCKCIVSPAMSAIQLKLPYKYLPSSNEIELIIFDLGGVLLEIDYSLTQEAFAQLGISDVRTLYSKAAQSDIFDNLETGSISPDEFRTAIGTVIGRDIQDEEIDSAWNALIQRLPIRRLESVAQLRKSHRTCMLSNTNEIHIPCFEGLIREQGMMVEYQAAFEQIFYSSRIGIRKPDEEAFIHVLTEMDVKPERTLFFDDSMQHIESAAKLGIHSYHLEVGKEDISDILIRFRNGLT